MNIHLKRALVFALFGSLLPVYGYVFIANILWPDSPWGIRQWHQILGVEMIFIPFCLLVGYLASKDFFA